MPSSGWPTTAGASIRAVPILEESGHAPAPSVKRAVPGATPPSVATLSSWDGGGGTGTTLTPAPGPVSEEVAVIVGCGPARSSAKITS